MLKTFTVAALLLSFSSFSYELNENSIDNGKVFAQGKPVTLLGYGINVGDPLPKIKLVDGNFSPVELQTFKGKPLLISVVPSLDTGICSLQTKYFNEQVAEKFPHVQMLTVSADLPFAQKRFCKTEGVEKLQVLSDAVWHQFGEKMGLYIKDMGLLSRAVFIFDSEGKVAYKQLVSDLSKEPDYQAVIAQLEVYK